MRDDPRTIAALPPEARPETGPRKELPPQFRRTLVDYYTKQPAGTIVIDTPNTYSCILPLPFSPPITLRKVRA